MNNIRNVKIKCLILFFNIMLHINFKCGTNKRCNIVIIRKLLTLYFNMGIYKFFFFYPRRSIKLILIH